MRIPFFIVPALAVSLTLGFAMPAVAARVDPPLTKFDGVALSPNGRFLADVESIASADEMREPRHRLIVRDVASGAAREVPLPCASVDGCEVTLPAWSHDSSTIAYVVHAPKRATRDVFVAKVAPGAIVPARILDFAGTFGGLKFSADDETLAGLAIPNARKEVGATQAGAAIVGEIGATPDEQRIAVLPLASRRVTYASPPDLFVYEFDWLPANAGFVGTAAPGDGDNNWWVAKLYRFDPGTKLASAIYSPSSPQQQLASPRASADGKYVAFIAGIMSDFGSTGGDLYTLALGGTGATPVDLTPNAPSSVTSFQWLCGSDELLLTRLRGANDEIALAPAAVPGDASSIDSTPEHLSAGDANVSRACEGPNGSLRLAAVRQTFEIAPEIYASAGGGNGLPWTALTHLNRNVPSETRARSLTWTSDGARVQGWLLEPPVAPAGRLPLITDVHGGPAAANVPRFVERGGIRDLLRHGYAVFLPNPRGSFGEGEAFTLANVKDFGYGDLRDILTGVDEAEKQDPAIDDARLGIEGGSYGGYMTMWAVTQTQRFKAAVAGAGVADWLSYYGENGIDEWMIPYFGASVYDDPSVYAKSSPIDFIKNVKTPTFEFVGERDVECPAPQSLEFWHALVATGTPTSLVIYPGEGHRIRSARNVTDITRRTLGWFDRYLQPPVH